MKNAQDDIDPFYLTLLLYSSGELDTAQVDEVEARLKTDKEAAHFLETLSKVRAIFCRKTEASHRISLLPRMPLRGLMKRPPSSPFHGHGSSAP